MSLSTENEFHVSEMRRKLGSLLVYGPVTEVSDDGRSVKVNLGKFDSPFLPVIHDSRSDDVYYKPYKKGVQVAIFNPGGNFTPALVLGPVMRSGESPKDGNPQVAFKDGPKIVYDEKTKTLSVESGSPINIKAKNVSIEVEGLKVKNTVSDLLKDISALLEKMVSGAALFVNSEAFGPSKLNPDILLAITETKTKIDSFSKG